MKRLTYIYEQGDHKWAAIARDPTRPGHIVDTLEYLVLSGRESMLLDPGGLEVFPAVYSAVSGAVDPACLTYLFASHQDPDIISSLALWLEVNPGLRCHLSWLWQSFVPHFGGRADTFIPLPDRGATLRLGHLELTAVPAHYLHSSGNFHLYDPKARILFSGDVGAALLPTGEQELFVRDFSRHIRHAEGFHRRWMGSEAAKRAWCERVAGLDIELLCPQHGAIYQGRDVGRFIDWFADLPVGTGLDEAARP